MHQKTLRKLLTEVYPNVPGGNNEVRILGLSSAKEHKRGVIVDSEKLRDRANCNLEEEQGLLRCVTSQFAMHCLTVFPDLIIINVNALHTNAIDHIPTGINFILQLISVMNEVPFRHLTFHISCFSAYAYDCFHHSHISTPIHSLSSMESARFHIGHIISRSPYAASYGARKGFPGWLDDVIPFRAFLQDMRVNQPLMYQLLEEHIFPGGVAIAGKRSTSPPDLVSPNTGPFDEPAKTLQNPHNNPAHNGQGGGPNGGGYYGSDEVSQLLTPSARAENRVYEYHKAEETLKAQGWGKDGGSATHQKTEATLQAQGWGKDGGSATHQKREETLKAQGWGKDGGSATHHKAEETLKAQGWGKDGGSATHQKREETLKAQGWGKDGGSAICAKRKESFKAKGTTETQSLKDRLKRKGWTDGTCRRDGKFRKVLAKYRWCLKMKNEHGIEQAPF
ncbi:hypothetical protein TrCOL_g997 [Triparma columacea]|uniref:Uncharacterized protein n=1 Tax=Triparma columacea TaxID=722753 RepID=A0A9W7FVD3_9STRA|nr:hypothetical protein TrCOL_g997 [Triparma columacea]